MSFIWSSSPTFHALTMMRRESGLVFNCLMTSDALTDILWASSATCPTTSSMGRLFDAISSLLGLRTTVNYEGQAAIELEAGADNSVREEYHFAVEEGPAFVLDFRNTIREIVHGAASVSFELGLHDLPLVGATVRSALKPLEPDSVVHGIKGLELMHHQAQVVAAAVAKHPDTDAQRAAHAAVPRSRRSSTGR